MSDGKRAMVRAGLARALAFARSAEPRVPPSRSATVTDIVIAAAVLAAAVIVAKLSSPVVRLILDPHTGAVVEQSTPAALTEVLRHASAAVVVTSVPLAVRRRFPLAAFGVLLLGAIATRRYATDVTFVAIVFAGYSAAAYSRFRGAALLGMFPAGLVVAVAFWNVTPATGPEAVPVPLQVGPATPWRLTAVVVAASLVSIAVVGNAVQARDRIRRLRAEHEAATRRALALERARIAGEMHDVVTHNVSMIVVQAGAARRVLSADPAAAIKALRAVESSGRMAMTELRHMLGLLSPHRGPSMPVGRPGNRPPCWTLAAARAVAPAWRRSPVSTSCARWSAVSSPPGCPSSCISAGHRGTCRPAWDWPCSGWCRRRSPT